MWYLYKMNFYLPVKKKMKLWHLQVHGEVYSERSDSTNSFPPSISVWHFLG